jgi:hypothetical protein
MLVWKMGNFVTAAFWVLSKAVSRTRDRGPSAPMIMVPETIVPSEKVAITPLPLSLNATSTSDLPY